MRKIQILQNKPVHLGITILQLSKTAICVFWSDYVNPKYGEKTKLRFADKERFIAYVKRDDISEEDISEDISEDAETRFDTSTYELSELLLKGKNKKVIDMIKDELGGKIMK